ncbi:hypothetical protein Tco_0305990, partial [Tanacetum coccineum]
GMKGVYDFINVKFGGAYKFESHTHSVSFIQGTTYHGCCEICSETLKSKMIFKCLTCKFAIDYECADAIEIDDAVESDDPIESDDAVESDDPIESDDAVESDDPIESDDAVESDDPIDYECADAIEIDDAVESDDPIESDDAV